MHEKDYFKCVSVLQNTMLDDNKLKVIHSHRVWTTSFVWVDPVSIKLVLDVERQLGMNFSKDFVAFLTTVSNGAILYRDIDDAMTGYEIFSTNTIIEKQERWRRSLKDLWLPQFIAIGEIISENRPIIMDTKSPTKDGQSYNLLEGSVYDPVSNWEKLSQSFHEWINQLITAQGAQYWLWR